jgi:rRNA-processing protein FCF1
MMMKKLKVDIRKAMDNIMFHKCDICKKRVVVREIFTVGTVERKDTRPLGLCFFCCKKEYPQIYRKIIAERV